MKIQLHSNQRGVAHLMLILVVVLIVGVGGAGYYVWSKQDKKSSGSSTNTASQKAAEAECKRTIEDKDLCKAASSFDFDSGNYVLTITSTVEGQKQSWTLQNDGKNSQMNFLGMETITYNGDSYMKDASGQWVKYPASDEEESEEFTDSLDFSEEEASWYTKVGKEPCGNLTCFHYSYKNPNDASENAEIYFDDKEYKIRKVTAVDEEAGAVEMTITYGNAKVSAPADYTEAEL